MFHPAQMRPLTLFIVIKLKSDARIPPAHAVRTADTSAAMSKSQQRWTWSTGDCGTVVQTAGFPAGRAGFPAMREETHGSEGAGREKRTDACGRAQIVIHVQLVECGACRCTNVGVSGDNHSYICGLTCIHVLKPGSDTVISSTDLQPVGFDPDPTRVNPC